MEEIIRQVGDWTNDEQLMRGALTIGGSVLAVAGVCWRVLRGKPDRVKYDGPADVEATFKPRVKV